MFDCPHPNGPCRARAAHPFNHSTQETSVSLQRARNFRRPTEPRTGHSSDSPAARGTYPSTTKLDDRRGYNPEESASFFANY